MDGRVDLVLDGGTCAGAGATTVDITEPYWKMIKGRDRGKGNRRVPAAGLTRMKYC